MRTVTRALIVAVSAAALALSFPASAERSFQLPSYMEDWSFVEHGSTTHPDMFDSVKNCNLGGPWRLSFGGSVRLRAEADNNLKLGTDPERNDSLWRHRSMLHLDVARGGMFRWYSEVAHADTIGSDRFTGGMDENDADLQNFFFDFTAKPTTPHSVTFRVGRQEMVFGQERLVGMEDFGNVRNTFDGLRIIGRTKRTETSLFATRPVERYEEHEIDEPMDSVAFGGLHSEFRPRPNHVVQGYYLVLHDEADNQVSEKTGELGDMTLTTIGGRYQWTHGGFIVETELAWQGGHLSDDSVHAGFATANASYGWNMVAWRPRLSWGFEVATGDHDGSDGRRGTFNPLFGSSHTGLGFMGVTGRRNIEAARVGIDVTPLRGLRWNSNVIVSQLEEDRDALYDDRGEELFKDPTGTSGDNIGVEVESSVSYEFCEHHEVELMISHLFAHEVVDNNGSNNDNDATWGFVGYTFRF